MFIYPQKMLLKDYSPLLLLHFCMFHIIFVVQTDGNEYEISTRFHFKGSVSHFCNVYNVYQWE